MEQRRQVTLLGDSILKGIQVDLSSRRYKPQNEMNVDALESELLESEPALLEPPQAARPSAAAPTPAAFRKLRREMRFIVYPPS